MWILLRELLAHTGLCEPGKDRLTLIGHLLPVGTGNTSTLGLTIGSRSCSLRTVNPDGRFRLHLPLDQLVRIVVVRGGCLPRVLEIPPSRSTLTFGRDPVHLRCTVELVLTRRILADGQAAPPLLERIMMPRGTRPLMVEWDHVPHLDRREELAPLFLGEG